MDYRLPLVGLIALLGVACRPPATRGSSDPYDLSIVESDTITAVPTRENPQKLEGKLSLNKDNYKVYHLLVPPGTRLKAQLQGTPRDFHLMFVSSSKGRIQDPGLEVNKLLQRSDAAFYENKTDTTKTIYCIVRGFADMENKSFTVIFTDF